jgi:DNA repair photolyase
MSLRTYTGEYLVSPVPLHLDLDLCSHGCWWCFSRLNNPDRLADYGPLKAAINAYLKKSPPGASLVKRFLLDGHPILVSNTSDPFAASTWPKFEPFWHLCQDAGIPVTIQTRGGKAAIPTLTNATRPTMVYVSVTSDREDLLRRNEPGAPGFAERLELIQAAQAAGHFAVVGLNPFYLPWWQDPAALVARLADAGLRHVWFGSLHLHRFQVDRLSPRRRQQEAKAIAYAQKKQKPDHEVMAMVQSDLEQAGINVFRGHCSRRGGFWEPYFAMGMPFFPTLEGFLDHLRQAGGGQPVAFSFDYFDRWANPAPDFQGSACKEYLNGFGRSIRNTGQQATARSFREVHSWYWRIWEFPTTLRHDDLYVATDGVDSLLVNDDGRPWWIYAPGHGQGLTLPGDIAGIILK